MQNLCSEIYAIMCRKLLSNISSGMLRRKGGQQKQTLQKIVAPYVQSQAVRSAGT
jgi:hypothetical protein